MFMPSSLLMHLCSGIEGGTKVQTIPPADADRDLRIRSHGRNWIGKDIHGSRIEDNIKAVQVPERRHCKADSSSEHALGRRGLLWRREDGGVLEATVSRPAS